MTVTPEQEKWLNTTIKRNGVRHLLRTALETGHTVKPHEYTDTWVISAGGADQLLVQGYNVHGAQVVVVKAPTDYTQDISQTKAIVLMESGQLLPPAEYDKRQLAQLTKDKKRRVQTVYIVPGSGYPETESLSHAQRVAQRREGQTGEPATILTRTVTYGRWRPARSEN